MTFTKTIQFVLTNYDNVELILMEVDPEDELYWIIKNHSNYDVNDHLEYVLRSGGMWDNELAGKKYEAIDACTAAAYGKSKDFKKYNKCLEQMDQLAKLQGKMRLINSFQCAIEDGYWGWKGYSIVLREVDEDEE